MSIWFHLLRLSFSGRNFWKALHVELWMMPKGTEDMKTYENPILIPFLSGKIWMYLFRCISGLRYKIVFFNNGCNIFHLANFLKYSKSGSLNARLICGENVPSPLKKTTTSKCPFLKCRPETLALRVCLDFSDAIYMDCSRYNFGNQASWFLQTFWIMNLAIIALWS